MTVRIPPSILSTRQVHGHCTVKCCLFIFSEAPAGRGWHGILMRLTRREPTNSVAGMDAVRCWTLENSEPRSRSAARPVGAPEMVARHRAAVVQPSVTTNRVTITRICDSRVTYCCSNDEGAFDHGCQR